MFSLQNQRSGMSAQGAKPQEDMPLLKTSPANADRLSQKFLGAGLCKFHPWSDNMARPSRCTPPCASTL